MRRWGVYKKLFIGDNVLFNARPALVWWLCLLVGVVVIVESGQSLQQRMPMQKKRRIKEPKGTSRRRRSCCWQAEERRALFNEGQSSACQKTDNNYESEDYATDCWCSHFLASYYKTYAGCLSASRRRHCVFWRGKEFFIQYFFQFDFFVRKWKSGMEGYCVSPLRLLMGQW